MPIDYVTVPTRVRYFMDSRAREWKAFERQQARAGWEAMTVLVFESAVSFRCVHSYPSNWPELSDAGLEELSWRT